MDSDFWTGLRDAFTNWFSGGNAQQYTGYEPMETTIPQPGGPAAQSGQSGLGSVFKGLGREVAPGLAQMGSAALINKMFPSTPGKVIAPDTRTPQGTAAENLRLQNAGASSGALAQARAGQLDPYMEHEIKRKVRAADAARGMLNTGGSGVREVNAIQEELNRVINREGGNVSAMTQGYNNSWPMYRPGQENPWAKLATAALQPGIGAIAKKAYDTWVV